MILNLRKSPYGLKQSSHTSYGTFKDFMMSIGFVASRVDGGLFVLVDHGAVVLYLDGPLIIANDSLIRQIQDQMQRRFRIHHLGSVSFNLLYGVRCPESRY
jgi:hypothetical protein